MWYNRGMDLFDFGQSQQPSTAPLADRVRPRTLNEFIGQKHLIGDNSLLVRAIKADKLGNCIFYGPPGTGKTTLAGIIAATTKGAFEKLNAVSSGVAEAKRVIEEARTRLKMYGKKTYLLLDECHRWNKAQSDSVLGAMEDGSIIFIGSTTENPFFSMTKAIVSRCRIFELKGLTDADVIDGLHRAVADERGLKNMHVEVTDEAYEVFAWGAAGDLRNALNALELAALTTPIDKEGVVRIDKATAEQSIQRKSISVDETLYYDMLSAFCKSLRGSDPDAALYWAFHLIEAGCDPLIIFRRLWAHASEDVGMADTNAMQVVTAACTAYEHLGIAEGSLPLAHAIIYVSTAPKSNSVVTARDRVTDAVKNRADNRVPEHLLNRDAADGHEKPKYLYPHSFGGYCKQQYLPDSLKNEVYYTPSDHGKEADVKRFLDDLRAKFGR